MGSIARVSARDIFLEAAVSDQKRKLHQTNEASPFAPLYRKEQQSGDTQGSLLSQVSNSISTEPTFTRVIHFHSTLQDFEDLSNTQSC